MNHRAFRPRRTFRSARGVFMPPFASGVNRFFRFRQNFFFAACCSKIRFLKSRCRVMHPTAVSVNRFFRFPQNFFCRGPNRSGFKRRKANVVRRPLSVKHFLDFFQKNPQVRAGHCPGQRGVARACRAAVVLPPAQPPGNAEDAPAGANSPWGCVCSKFTARSFRRLSAQVASAAVFARNFLRRNGCSCAYAAARTLQRCNVLAGVRLVRHLRKSVVTGQEP